MALKRPPTILFALERLKDFVTHPNKFGFLTFNRPGLPRLMRSERRKSVSKVLAVLVASVDLVTGRIVRPLGRYQQADVFADCSLSWLAESAGVSRRTLCRVIVDLESVGWLRRDSQEIMKGDEWGTFAVATVVRRLTRAFFVALGLGWRLDKDQEYLTGVRRARIWKTLMRIVSTKEKQKARSPQTQGWLTPQAEKADLSSWLAQSLENAHQEFAKKNFRVIKQ